MLNHQSDMELVRRVQAGETEAFDEIDRRYRVPLCRFLSRHTLGPEHAEELGQRTLIRAFEMIDQLRAGEKLAGWLHRIAFRLATAEGRRRTVASLDALDAIEPEVLEKHDDEETPGRLWQIARERLSDEEYRVLTLRYRDDFSLPKIAELLDKSEGAVRVQLHRARKKLLPCFKTRLLEVES